MLQTPGKIQLTWQLLPFSSHSLNLEKTSSIPTTIVWSLFNTLDKFRFLYKKVDGDDKTVISLSRPSAEISGGAFVVQTLAAHFSAINGAYNLKILEVDQLNSAIVKPTGALALSCSAICDRLYPFNYLPCGNDQFEQGLTLVATGTLTIEMIKTTPLPKTLNHSAAKTSTQQTGFNAVTWGQPTRTYVKSIAKGP